jgi:hypothetical protein
VDGWGNTGRVPVFLDNSRPVCGACAILPMTRLYVIHPCGLVNSASGRLCDSIDDLLLLQVDSLSRVQVHEDDGEV